MSHLKIIIINNSLSYREGYINHANIPETQARSRRLTSFESASELKEILNKESYKHIQIFKSIKKQTNACLIKTFFWELGNMAVLLCETYKSNLEDYQCEKLYIVEIPVNIAPYCGGWNDALDAKPGTKSFLITTCLKKRQLDKVLQRLKEQSEKMPRWNFIREVGK